MSWRWVVRERPACTTSRVSRYTLIHSKHGMYEGCAYFRKKRMRALLCTDHIDPGTRAIHVTIFCQIMVLTTNLVLDGEQLEHGAARFFSETSRASEGQVCVRFLESCSFRACTIPCLKARSVQSTVTVCYYSRLGDRSRVGCGSPYCVIGYASSGGTTYTISGAKCIPSSIGCSTIARRGR